MLVVMGDSPGYEYGVARLLIFDIQNPAHPMQVGAMDVTNSLNYRAQQLIRSRFEPLRGSLSARNRFCMAFIIYTPRFKFLCHPAEAFK